MGSVEPLLDLVGQEIEAKLEAAQSGTRRENTSRYSRQIRSDSECYGGHVAEREGFEPSMGC